MRSIADKEAADMKLAADYRALARDALRGRWKTAVLAGLLASALGANIVNATENITSNANRANQNSNITPGGSLELFSQANGGRLLAVLVACIVVWTLFTLVVGGAVRLGYARFNLNLADGKAAAVSDLFSQKGRLWDGFCLKFFQGLYVALWSLLLVIPGIVAAYRYRFAMLNLCENPEIGVMEALNMSKAQTLGFKWQLFVLDLSFIGWNILVGLTLGILDIWVAPYIAQSNIAFFQEIKKIKGVGFFPPRPEDDDQFRPHDPFGEDNW